MKETYGCNPRDIICCICPSIRKCHFEVDEDVYKMFYNEFKDLEEIENIIEKNLNKGKWNIDTVLINKIILRDAGLLEKNIVDSKLCSVCNKEYIHSFRVEKRRIRFGDSINKFNIKKMKILKRPIINFFKKCCKKYIYVVKLK